MDDFDSIERRVEIAAPIARVWQLVCEPGWYINDGSLTPHRIEKRGELSIVHDPVHGPFAFAAVELDEPRYAAFRWLQDPEDPETPSTLVEFRLTETAAESVILSVVESGLASLPGTAAERRERFDDNVEGWRIELALAKRHLEGA
ncbi:Uncharacterized conserved protein YndB, AHSA1/START domain [Paramicrobacterium humi]|uniref:Uncharacterized conserved protein YndB, AHSA1/START domain n=1 Tax=Paramicrobacterium humi TaxID=640635 RepID=A0A1H4LFY2_9MICO|nr:ATPase [Microbacterium humi]SEB69175.1 Uncharacterized conserved protein YndB, AHSA1/START domain [Microbacterium humi]